jgi:hypothetical protein
MATDRPTRRSYPPFVVSSTWYRVAVPGDLRAGVHHGQLHIQVDPLLVVLVVYDVAPAEFGDLTPAQPGVEVQLDQQAADRTRQVREKTVGVLRG